MQVIKKAVLGLVVGLSSASALAGAAGGPITLLYTGHFYSTTPVSLMVKIDDPIHNVSGQEFYDTCNGTIVVPLIVDPSTSNVINQEYSIYLSQLQSANATGSEVTVDYVVDTDYLGSATTACVIEGVYFGSF